MITLRRRHLAVTSAALAITAVAVAPAFIARGADEGRFSQSSAEQPRQQELPDVAVPAEVTERFAAARRSAGEPARDDAVAALLAEFRSSDGTTARLVGQKDRSTGFCMALLVVGRPGFTSSCGTGDRPRAGTEFDGLTRSTVVPGGAISGIAPRSARSVIVRGGGQRQEGRAYRGPDGLTYFLVAWPNSAPAELTAYDEAGREIATARDEAFEP